MALALIVIVFPILPRITEGVFGWETSSDILITVLAFVVAPTLAIVAIVAASSTDIGVGSLLVAATAVLTAYVVGVSLYVLLLPPENGGVYGGHIFSYLAAYLLSIMVLVRPLVNRLFARVWIRPKLIELS